MVCYSGTVEWCQATPQHQRRQRCCATGGVWGRGAAVQVLQHKTGGVREQELGGGRRFSGTQGQLCWAGQGPGGATQPHIAAARLAPGWPACPARS